MSTQTTALEKRRNKFLNEFDMHEIVQPTIISKRLNIGWPTAHSMLKQMEEEEIVRKIMHPEDDDKIPRTYADGPKPNKHKSWRIVIKSNRPAISLNSS